MFCQRILWGSRWGYDRASQWNLSTKDRVRSGLTCKMALSHISLNSSHIISTYHIDDPSAPQHDDDLPHPLYRVRWYVSRFWIGLPSSQTPSQPQPRKPSTVERWFSLELDWVRHTNGFLRITHVTFLLVLLTFRFGSTGTAVLYSCFLCWCFLCCVFGCGRIGDRCVCVRFVWAGVHHLDGQQ